MQKGTEKHPMHKFLGYLPSKHVLSMSIRDPDDAREMPTNGNDHVSANCLRGVRKVLFSFLSFPNSSLIYYGYIGITHRLALVHTGV